MNWSLYCTAPVIEASCLDHVAGCLAEGCQVVDGHSHIRVVGTENLFLDGERAAVERLCLGVALLRIAECGKIVQIDRHFIMGGTVCPLENC